MNYGEGHFEHEQTLRVWIVDHLHASQEELNDHADKPSLVSEWVNDVIIMHVIVFLFMLHHSSVHRLMKVHWNPSLGLHELWKYLDTKDCQHRLLRMVHRYMMYFDEVREDGSNEINILIHHSLAFKHMSLYGETKFPLNVGCAYEYDSNSNWTKFAPH